MKVMIGCILSGLLLSSVNAQVADTNAPAVEPLTVGSTPKPKYQVDGPLGAPLKSRKISELPKRVFQSINPFAPSKSEATQSIPKVSPRAWTDTVGWGAQSAFVNEVTHEPRLTLVTVTKPERK